MKTSKSLAVLMALAMILFFVSCRNSDPNLGYEVCDGFFYSINEDGETCTINGISAFQGTELIIPAELDGYTVVTLNLTVWGDGYLNKKTAITDITFPPTLKTIGSETFSGCTALENIVFSEGLEKIGSGAFRGCSSLKSVKIPASVMAIGEHIGIALMGIGRNPFANCENLSSITVDENSPYYYSENNCLIEKNVTKTLVAGCKTSIIPSNVTIIADGAFSGCLGLTNIDIPDSVIKIESSAFYNCPGLKRISIGKGLDLVGGSNSLFSFPVFSGCTALESIVVDEENLNYYSEGNCLIERERKQSVNGSVSIGGMGKASNEDVIVGGEEKYQTLILGCKTSVIPEGVLHIGNSAFDQCTGLINIAIPNSVISIESSAFRGCTGLTGITIPSSVTSINSTAFSGCTGLVSIVVEENNAKYYSNGNCLIEKDTNALILGCKTSIIPNTVVRIANNAFDGCTGLTSLNIPEGVLSIEFQAFWYCPDLTSITIPKSIQSVDVYAFVNSDNLVDITYESTVEDWGKVQKNDLYGQMYGYDKIMISHFVVHCTDGDVPLYE